MQNSSEIDLWTCNKVRMYATPRDIAFGASFCPNRETTRAANFRNERERFHRKKSYAYYAEYSMECSEHEFMICSLDNCLVLAWSIGLVLVSRTWYMNQLSHHAYT